LLGRPSNESQAARAMELTSASRSVNAMEGMLKAQVQPGWAALFGLVGGGAGAFAMLYAAGRIAKYQRLDVDIVRTLGNAAPFAAFGGDGIRNAGFAVALGAGATVGAVLGLLLMYVLGVFSRVLVGAILGPVLWTLVHAFVLRRYTPMLAEALPFAPMAIGAAAYGVCTALIPPLRKWRVVDPWDLTG